MGNPIKEISKIPGKLVETVGDVAGGLVDGVLGTNISGQNKMPEINVSAPVEQADPSLSTPTTPENSPTQIGTGDTTDTGFGDITSIFNTLSKQDDEWDQFLGRYTKNNK